MSVLRVKPDWTVYIRSTYSVAGSGVSTDVCDNLNPPNKVRTIINPILQIRRLRQGSYIIGPRIRGSEWQS